MLHRPRALAALVLVVAGGGGLLACSGSDTASAPATTAFGSNVSTTVAVAPDATVADTTGLGSFLPTPTGMTRVSAADAGPFDAITGASRFHQNDAEARARLTNGLVAGYSASYQGEGGSTSGVQLYQFNDAAAAEDFAGYIREHAMQGIENFNLRVPSIPGATGFVVTQPGTQSGTLGGVLFQKGPYLVYVGSAAKATDVGGLVQALSTAVYGALPSA